MNLEPGVPASWFEQGLQALQLGLGDEASVCFAHFVQSVPTHFGAWHNLSRALRLCRKDREAFEASAQALVLAPLEPLVYDNFLELGQSLGETAQVERVVRQRLEVAGEQPKLLWYLAWALGFQKNDNEGLLRLEAMVHTSSPQPGSWYWLARACSQAGHYDQAHEAFDRHLVEHPEDTDALYWRVDALEHLGAFDEVNRTLNRLFALEKSVRVYLMLSHAYLRRLGFEEALGCLYEAVAILPSDPKLLARLLWLLDHAPTQDPGEIRAVRDRFARVLEAAVPRTPFVETSTREPGRPLKIGYVSGDFCQHSAAHVFAPVVLGHHAGEFEVFCYSNTAREDAMTERFRQGVPHFVLVRHLSDDALRKRIVTDGIDILVDLSGISDGNRLGVFAARSAPVQATGWGYVRSTGLQCMDYLIADERLVPPLQQAVFSETLVYLPSALCLQPPVEACEVGPLPALLRGTVTFGSFNRYDKLTPRVIDTWATLLRFVPSASLLLKEKAYDQPGPVEMLRQRFRQHGIRDERVRFLGGTSRAQHLVAYCQVDIALDTFPAGGGVTTLEAAWMGVPTVCLQGQQPNERVAASIMDGLGLADWVADDLEAYLVRAVAAAGDLEGLAALRSRLRVRMEGCTLGNPDLYCAAVESLYRELWRKHCHPATDTHTSWC